MGIWGCDWSHWQGELNAGNVEREGFSYMWLKAGGAAPVRLPSGSAKPADPFYVDPWFERNANNLLVTDMVPGAYWFLVPGRAWEQAALMHAMLKRTGQGERWMAKLDVEQYGITREDVYGFLGMWRMLEPNWPLWCYTRKNFWLTSQLGMNQGMLLEEARWVPDAVAKDPKNSYASQQFKFVDPGWWNVEYAGWNRAHMLQFSGEANVDAKWVPVSRYPGSKQDLLTVGRKPE